MGSAASSSDGPPLCISCNMQYRKRVKRLQCGHCERTCCTLCVTTAPALGRKKMCSLCRTIKAGSFTRDMLHGHKNKDLRLFLIKDEISIHNCLEKHDLVDLIVDKYYTALTSAEHSAHVDQLRTRHEEMLAEERGTRTDTQTTPTRADSQTTPTPADTQTTPTPADSQTTPTPTDTRNTPTASDTQNTIFTGNTPTVSTDEQTRGEAAMDTDEHTTDETNDPTPSVPEHTDEPSQADTQTADRSATGSPSSPMRRGSLRNIKSREQISQMSARDLKTLLSLNFVSVKGCVEKRELVERVEKLWDGRQRASTLSDEDLCKICFDAPQNCVLLECGHVVTCVYCGKILAECPVCRCYVSRVVHIFKA